MTLYSQRDLRWRFRTLGTRGTIGQYGCLITCLSMIHKVTPPEMNSYLIAGGAFAYGNILNWTKLHAAVPQFNFVKRVAGYNNTMVKNAIALYGFCLVEVNAGSIGNPKGRHWVIYIGGQRMYDPFDGKEKATTAYSPTGFAVVKH